MLKAQGAGSDGKNVHIHRLNASGTIGSRVADYKWTSGWTSAEFYETSGHSYLFLLKAGTGDVRIHRVNASGSIGQRIFDRTWSKGWTHARFFEARDQLYLFLYKQGLGTVHVHAIRTNGKLGPRVVTYGKKPSYTSHFSTGSEAD